MEETQCQMCAALGGVCTYRQGVQGMGPFGADREISHCGPQRPQHDPTPAPLGVLLPPLGQNGPRLNPSTPARSWLFRQINGLSELRSPMAAEPVPRKHKGAGTRAVK